VQNIDPTLQELAYPRLDDKWIPATTTTPGHWEAGFMRKNWKGMLEILQYSADENRDVFLGKQFGWQSSAVDMDILVRPGVVFPSMGTGSPVEVPADPPPSDQPGVELLDFNQTKELMELNGGRLELHVHISDR
jgi:hypothetical protein